MKEVTVNKSELLNTLMMNRDEHMETVEKAKVAHREAVVKEMRKRATLISKGGDIDLYLNLPQPEDYTAAFDEAIDAVTWEKGDTITLDRNTFNEWVRNQWHWKNHFVGSTRAYVGGN